MPWTETSIHFSSQCLNRGVKIFLFLFFFNCCYIHCMPWKRPKKKAALKLPWVTSGPGCACTNPSPCWETHTASCLPVLECLAFFSQGRDNFFTSLDTFSPEGTISLFPWAEVSSCGKGHKCPQEAAPWVGMCWDTLRWVSADFSWRHMLALVRINKLGESSSGKSGFGTLRCSECQCVVIPAGGDIWENICLPRSEFPKLLLNQYNH